MTWIQTSSGQAIDFLNPDPKAIRLTDIATMLSRIPRFNGGTRVTEYAFSVASHCLLALRTVPLKDPRNSLAVLMHDAHEFATGDMTTPWKQALTTISGCDAVGRIQDSLQRAIEVAAGMDHPDGFKHQIVKRADLLALAIERRDLMVPEPKPWGINLPDLKYVDLIAQPEIESVARVRFISQFLELAKEAGIRPMETFLHGT